MTNVNFFIEQLPKYKGERALIRRRQSIQDIMHDLLHKHKKNAADCDKIAKFFWRGSARATAEYLYDFCRDNIDYKIEDTLHQSVKTIAGILVEGEGDCKHYAQFIVGICCALNRMGYPIRAKYRFAIYDNTPGADGVKSGHVFAVVMDNGQEIWTDPVLSTFDQRTPKYISHQDKIPPMSAARIGEVWDVSGVNRGFGNETTLSGMRNETVLSGAVMVARDQRGTTYEMAPDTRVGYLDYFTVGKAKKHHKGLHLHAPHIKIQPGKLLKKYGLAANHNAFLAYLKINAFHTGSHMYDKIMHDPAAKKAIFDKWASIGGNTNKLMTALTQARNVWNKSHPSHRLSGSYGMGADSQVGVLPLAAAPALLAAAAPIIKMFQNIFKSFGINHASNDDLDKADTAAADDHNNATKTKGDGNADINEDGTVDHGNGITTKVSKDSSGKQTLTYEAADTTGDGDDNNMTRTKTKTVTKTSSDTDGDGEDDEETTTKTKTITKSGSTGIMAFWDNTKNFVIDHKGWFIAGGLTVIGLIVIPKVYRSMTGTKKRRK